MVARLIAVIVIVLSLSGAVASADTIVRVQVVEKPSAAPTTQPGAPAVGQPVMSVETLAEAGGSFLARTSRGNEIIEIKGKLDDLGAGRRRVRVSFSDRGEGRAQAVSTSIELSLDQPFVISNMKSGGGSRDIVLTLASEPAN